jgi:hypothetical protein
MRLSPADRADAVAYLTQAGYKVMIEYKKDLGSYLPAD